MFCFESITWSTFFWSVLLVVFSWSSWTRCTINVGNFHPHSELTLVQVPVELTWSQCWTVVTLSCSTEECKSNKFEMTRVYDDRILIAGWTISANDIIITCLDRVFFVVVVCSLRIAVFVEPQCSGLFSVLRFQPFLNFSTRDGVLSKH